MPIGNGATNGQNSGPQTTALPSIFANSVVIGAGGASTVSAELHGDGLSMLNVYLNKVVGAGAVTALVEFAQGVAIGGQPVYHPITAVIGPVVVGAPLLTNFKLGARRYRITVTVGAGGATYSFRMTASL